MIIFDNFTLKCHVSGLAFKPIKNIGKVTTTTDTDTKTKPILKFKPLLELWSIQKIIRITKDWDSLEMSYWELNLHRWPKPYTNTKTVT